ncbi:MAG TPA: sulfotransferase [Acidimicrobiia bacterium]
MVARGEGRRVLVVGIPRSGTTWVGKVLGQADGSCYVHEPDNHLVRPEAWWAKRELGSYPRLLPGQAAPDYERLFRVAFAGGARPSLLSTWARAVHRCGPRREFRTQGGPGGLPGTRRLARGPAAPRPRAGGNGDVVVKSIFCARSLEWLAERFEPAVVVVERHPFAVIGSWAELGWSGFLDADPAAVAECRAAFGVEAPRIGASWVDRAAWHFGFLSAVLGRARDRHPDWQVVGHETLCAGPEAEFEDLCDRLGLRFGAGARRFLLASNRPGKGYSTNRVWAEQLGGRRRLSPSEQERVSEMLSRFAAVPPPRPAAPRRVPAPTVPPVLVPAPPR